MKTRGIALIEDSLLAVLSDYKKQNFIKILREFDELRQGSGWFVLCHIVSVEVTTGLFLEGEGFGWYFCKVVFDARETRALRNSIINPLKIKNMKEQIDPEKVKKAIQIAIYVLTAILGFFTGGGVQAATLWI